VTRRKGRGDIIDGRRSRGGVRTLARQAPLGLIGSLRAGIGVWGEILKEVKGAKLTSHQRAGRRGDSVNVTPSSEGPYGFDQREKRAHCPRSSKRCTPADTRHPEGTEEEAVLPKGRASTSGGRSRTKHGAYSKTGRAATGKPSRKHTKPGKKEIWKIKSQIPKKLPSIPRNGGQNLQQRQRTPGQGCEVRCEGRIKKNTTPHPHKKPKKPPPPPPNPPPNNPPNPNTPQVPKKKPPTNPAAEKKEALSTEKDAHACR